MRVCDRHPDRKSVFEIVIPRDETTIDLCGECRDEFKAFLSPPVPLEVAQARRGRPPKNSA